MKSLDYARILLPASILILAACDNRTNFTGEGLVGDGGGLAGGGGGGGGGGPVVTIEPNMQYGPDQSPGFGGVVISGNASKIVFVDDADPLGMNPAGEWQLFSYDIGSMAVTQITDGSATAVPNLFDFDITDGGGSVVWSSSDDFVGSNPNNQFNIFKASTSAGGSITQVTAINAGFVSNPKVSANGSVVVFRSSDDLTGNNPANDTHIFSINADGSNLTQVTNIPLEPDNIAFSDDGSTIAFEGVGDPLGMNADGTREIFVIDIDGNNLAQLSMSNGNSFEAKISDDGSRVIFTSQADLTGGNSDGTYEVFVANSDGSSTVQISDGDRDSGTFASGAPGSYDISGDGSFVVFASGANLTGENPDTQHTLFWAAASGGTVSQVLRDGTIAVGATDRTADQPSMTNDGFGMAFESSANLTSDTQPEFVKIYTHIRQ